MPLVSSNDPHSQIVENAKRFKVCWETFPEFSGTNHERKETGFTVELYGTSDRSDVVPTAGCRHCIPVLQALLSLADYIVPDAWHDALDSVRARSGLEYAVERAGRPDVVVAVTVLPRGTGAIPGDPKSIAQCLAEIKTRLAELGASERSWREPAH